MNPAEREGRKEGRERERKKKRKKKKKNHVAPLFLSISFYLNLSSVFIFSTRGHVTAVLFNRGD